MSSPNPLMALFGGGQIQPAAAPAPPTTVTLQGVTPLVLAAMFAPQFRPEIICTGGYWPGVTWKPGKHYAASEQDAVTVKAILEASGIAVAEVVRGYPGGVIAPTKLFAWLADGKTPTDVPWFKIAKPDGGFVLINVGQLAGIFDHGESPTYELATLLGAIQENLAA